jgi:hypothetical protein
MSVNVRDVAENDFFAWLPLFDTYSSNRGRRLDDTKALIVWSWIQDPRNALRAAVAVDDAGTLVGLVHAHPELRTLDGSIGVVIDDLFVVDTYRHGGVDGLLFERVRTLAGELQATRVAWANDPGDAAGLRRSEELGRRSPAVVFEMDL